ncbi:MAG TPA: aldehyde dehydrogenase family protein, partial [Chitinophagaceae bacterium]|nr:aldehyde dehydrogenase family protein [Chitinophagaceae bacterium]
MSMDLSIPEFLENYIDGRFFAPVSQNYIDNVNPATGELIGHIPDSNEKDVTEAVAAAENAFPNWSVTPVEKRFMVLNRI